MERNYEYTGVRLPKDIKRKIRLLAANKGASVSEMGSELIAIGLETYLSKGATNLDSQQARELAEFVKLNESTADAIEAAR
jgi:hypothetical protein